MPAGRLTLAAWSPLADMLVFCSVALPSLAVYDLSRQLWSSIQCPDDPCVLAWGHCGLLSVGCTEASNSCQLLQVEASPAAQPCAVTSSTSFALPSPSSDPTGTWDSATLAPDGRHAILFGEASEVEAAILDCLTGRTVSLFLQFWPDTAQWSPDGSRVLFSLSDDDTHTTTFTLVNFE